MNQDNSDSAEFDELVEIHKANAATHDVFAVILFTEADPFLVKVLRDSDLWEALDEVSGPRWVVFAIRPAESEGTFGHLVKVVTQKVLNLAHDRIFGADTFTTVLEAIPKWTQAKQNLRLLKKFRIDCSELPMLLIFTELKTGDVLQIKWPFSAKNEETAFTSLKEILKKGAKAISQVREQYVKGNEEVFNLLQAEKIQYTFLRRAKKAMALIELLKTLSGK